MSKTVAVLGPAGTFSHLAAKSYFGSTAVRFEQSLYSVFESVVNGNVQVGVVPIENSTNGTVGQTLDLLLRHNDSVRISGEVFVPVRHCLAALPGIENITTIYSHVQALDQCAQYLAVHYPNATRSDSRSTALGLQQASDTQDRPVAAIGSEFAAKLYGLDIIDRDIQDSDNNYTMFFVISRDKKTPAKADRTTICVDVSDRRDEPGTLCRLIYPIQELGVNLSYIQSRPTGAARSAYRFFFTLDGPAQSDRVRLAIQFTQGQGDVKVLGSYKSAQVGN